jgi:deferrochelatase/peroxidase EfeB
MDLALNVITDADGDELKILRDNMAFGNVGSREFGTYYIGYAKTPSITERMLRTCSSAIRRGHTTASWTSPRR